MRWEKKKKNPSKQTAWSRGKEEILWLPHSLSVFFEDICISPKSHSFENTEMHVNLHLSGNRTYSKPWIAGNYKLEL